MSIAEEEAARRTRARRQDPVPILLMFASTAPASAAAAAVTTLPRAHTDSRHPQTALTASAQKGKGLFEVCLRERDEKFLAKGKK